MNYLAILKNGITRRYTICKASHPSSMRKPSMKIISGKREKNSFFCCFEMSKKNHEEIYVIPSKWNKITILSFNAFTKVERSTPFFAHIHTRTHARTHTHIQIQYVCGSEGNSKQTKRKKNMEYIKNAVELWFLLSQPWKSIQFEDILLYVGEDQWRNTITTKFVILLHPNILDIHPNIFKSHKFIKCTDFAFILGYQRKQRTHALHTCKQDKSYCCKWINTT